MKTIFVSTIMILCFNQIANGQTQYLQIVNEIGKIMEKDDLRTPPSKVVQVIFMKLDRKYKLVKLEKNIESTLVKLIQMRRGYKATIDTKKLIDRVFDHAIASGITPIEGIAYGKWKDASCRGAKVLLDRALEKYDSAVKAYQKCLNPSSFAAELRTLDVFLSGSPSNLESNTSDSNCDSHIQDINDAIKEIGRWSNFLVENDC